MKTFEVNIQTDWAAVASYLLQQAVTEASGEPVEDNAETIADSAWDKARRGFDDGLALELRRQGALIIYRVAQPTALSLMSAKNAQAVHLSVTEVLPGPRPMMRRPADALAFETAAAILGPFTEASSPLPEVRHFYRAHQQGSAGL